MRNGKSVLSKKLTPFILYVDERTKYTQSWKATGMDKDAQILRELLDEALAGRRRKIAQQLTLPETRQADNAETLETIQTLLLKLIEQGEKARGVRGICLELRQEVLAEAHAETELMISTFDSEANQFHSRSASKMTG